VMSRNLNDRSISIVMFVLIRNAIKVIILFFLWLVHYVFSIKIISIFLKLK